MTIRPAVRRLYIPSVGQADAAARASALAAVLAPAELIQDSRYGSRITQAPAVVLDFGYDVVVVLEPTTHAAVDAAQDAFLDDQLPDTVARLSDIGAELTDAVAAHSAATNPHNITPAAIGAATAGHDHGPENEHFHDDNHIPASIARDSEVTAAIATHAATPHGGGAHSHVDADLPAGLARDAEVAAMYAPIHSHPYSSDTHNHDTTYAPTHGHPYAATSHAHVDADLPATITRDTELTSAISTHEAAANPHATYLTQAEGDAAYATTGHTHAGGGITGGVIRKTANQTMTATAQTAVADMSFPVAASSSYFFQMAPVITTSTGTSPTTAWGFTGPAGATVSIIAEIDTSTSVETNAVITAFGNFASGAQVANSGARFWGVVVTGATAGTVQLTAARGGTTPSMVVAAGSNGLFLKVA